MNRVLILSACLLLIFCTAVLGEDQNPLRTISVSGTVEWKIAPDQIVWTISLTDSDKELSKAKNKSDDKVKSVLALQKKLSLDDGDLQTGRLFIRREFERDRHGHPLEFKHFVINRKITIRQRDLTRFDEFFDTLISSANMEVDFKFEASQIEDVRADMRLKAMQVAKDKAEAMAAAVGATLGQVLTINEHSPRSRGPNPFNVSVVHSEPSADLATEMFVPGAISERVTVYVTFELE
jgi:uncharacterized protein YggE